MSSIDIDEVLQDGNLDDLLTLHAAGASDSLYIMNSLFNNNAFDFHLLTDSKKLPRNWRLAFLHIIEVWFMSSKDESKVTSSHLSVLSELVRLDLIDPRNIIPDLVVHLIEGNDVWRNNLLSNPRTSAVRGLEKYMALSNADAITTCEMLKCGQGDPLKMLHRQKLQGFINRYPEILIYLASHPSLEDDNAFWKFLNLTRSVDMPMIFESSFGTLQVYV
ncbi:hypothetical protein BC829DRAFT_130179 [Chytridium lagenaria]|nr:hypothetical protein BC829DRAFT_130179 [Chytridium lagenaria]